MIRFRQYHHGLFVLTLAMCCAGGKVCAQENASRPNIPLVTLDIKQAAGLVLSQPAPVYPPVAKVNYLQGHVQLELTVNDNGKVASAHVLDGNAILAVAAMKAALRWNYKPLTTDSGPSGFITIVKIKFTLNCQGMDLTPRQAERDFLRQVKPPQVVRQPDDAHPEDVVHMRLLVNDQGEVVDQEIWHAGRAHVVAAHQTLQGWIFRPARWGSLPIASYLEVDVPVSAPSIAQASAAAGRR